MNATVDRINEVDRVMKSWDHQKTELFVLLAMTAWKGGYTGDHAKIAMAEMGVSFEDWKEWNKQKEMEEGSL